MRVLPLPYRCICREDVDHFLYAALCLTTALLESGDTATATKVADWAAGRPGVVAMLIGKLRLSCQVCDCDCDFTESCVCRRSAAGRCLAGVVWALALCDLHVHACAIGSLILQGTAA